MTVTDEAIYSSKKYLFDDYLDAYCDFLQRKTAVKCIL